MTEHDDIVDLLHRAVDPAPAGDEQIAATAAAARRHRMARRTAAVMAVAAVLAIALVVPWDARPTRVDLVDRPATPAPVRPSWHGLPDAPLDPRWGAFATVSGDGLLVWGGYVSAEGVAEGPRDDGAVYGNGRWSALPDGPLAPRMRMGGAAGWIEQVERDGTAGREYWIVGGTGGADGRTSLQDAAAYRPQDSGDGQWHELPAVPEPIIAGTVVGGEAMVAVGLDTDGGRALYELRPGDRQWRTLVPSLPSPPAIDNSDLQVLAAGDHLIVVGQGAMFVTPASESGGGGLRWQRVAAPDGARTLDNVRGAVADRARDAVVVLLSDGTYRYDLVAREWSRIAGGLQPDPPQPIPLVRTADDALVAVDVVGGQVHALVGDDGWTALPPLDGSRVDAAVQAVEPSVRGLGDVVVWGGMGTQEASPQGVMLARRAQR